MIQRKKTGSIVCPGCGRLISVSSSKCIHCGRRNPGLWGFAPELKRLFGSYGGLIPAIIIFCVTMYVLSLLMDLGAIFRPRGMFGFLTPSNMALLRLGGTGLHPLRFGKFWTLITAIYLHGDVLHILFNMLWIRQIGPTVEELFGTARTFLIFTLSGILGYIASVVFGVEFTLGASGSVFGLLGALVYYGRKRGGYFGNQIFRQVGMWAVIMFVFGLMMPYVNNSAHAGGFIGGYIAAHLLGYQELKVETTRHQLWALVAVIVTGLAFFIEIFLAY
ncbi:rhomboid family intramembrane serine protease [candidate division KSB1 bacterium]|nr:rhomboid family intramembrane serine protease [candidate division KSB1 bacterium]